VLPAQSVCLTVPIAPYEQTAATSPLRRFETEQAEAR
jgi:hypothetical protein